MNKHGSEKMRLDGIYFKRCQWVWDLIFKASGINKNLKKYWFFDTNFLMLNPWPDIRNLKMEDNILLIPKDIEGEMRAMYKIKSPVGRHGVEKRRKATAATLNLMRTKHDGREIFRIFNIRDDSVSNFNRDYFEHLIKEFKELPKGNAKYEEISDEDKWYIFSVMALLLNVNARRKYEEMPNTEQNFCLIIGSFDTGIIHAVRWLLNNKEIRRHIKYINRIYYTTAKIKNKGIAEELMLIPINSDSPYI